MGDPTRPEFRSSQVWRAEESYQQLPAKIAEMNVEKNEHTMVTSTLEPMDPNRKCWILVGGVLVERTCGEVLPAVKENLASIEEVVARLTKQYDDKEEEIKQFQEKYNIRLQGQAPPQASKPAEEKKEAQGVLVS